MDQFFVVYQPADRVTLSGAARTARVEGMGGGGREEGGELGRSRAGRLQKMQTESGAGFDRALVNSVRPSLAASQGDRSGFELML